MAKSLTFIETDVFTKRIVKMVDDETYAGARSFKEPVVFVKSAWPHGEKASAVARE
jgi:hypothetical protein